MKVPLGRPGKLARAGFDLKTGDKTRVSLEPEVYVRAESGLNCSQNISPVHLIDGEGADHEGGIAGLAQRPRKARSASAGNRCSRSKNTWRNRSSRVTSLNSLRMRHATSKACRLQRSCTVRAKAACSRDSDCSQPWRYSSTSCRAAASRFFFCWAASASRLAAKT